MFDWVRDCEAVQNEFEQIFREPLVATGETTTNAPNPSQGEEVPNVLTVH